MLRRFLVFLSVFIFMAFCLHSEDLIAQGKGSTRDEALNMAWSDMASKAGVSVEGSSDIFIHGRNNGEYENTATVDNAISINYEFTLYGANIETNINRAGEYVVKVTVPENMASAYLQECNQLYPVINKIYKSIYGSFLASLNLKLTELSDLQVLLNLVKSYNAYAKFSIMLNPSLASEIKILPITEGQINADIQTKLTGERNSLAYQSEIQRVLQEAGQLSEEEEKAFADMNRELAENAQLQSKMEKERYEALKVQLQGGLDSTLAMLENAEEIGMAESEFSLTDLIIQVEARRNVFSIMLNEMDEELTSVYDAMEEESKEYYDRRMAEDYPDNDKNFFGFVKSSEKKKREEGVKYSIKETIQPKYIEQAKNIYQIYATHLVEFSEEVREDITAINKDTFTLTTNDSEVAVAITSYNDDTNCFSGYVDVTIGNDTIRLTLEIPYTVWTGNPVPSYKNLDAYQLFRANISDWLDILRSNSSLIYLSIKFNVGVSMKASEYVINFVSFNVGRLDTLGNGELYEIPLGLTSTLSYTPSVNMEVFSPSSRKANNMIALFKEESEEILNNLFIEYGIRQEMTAQEHDDSFTDDTPVTYEKSIEKENITEEVIEQEYAEKENRIMEEPPKPNKDLWRFPLSFFISYNGRNFSDLETFGMGGAVGARYILGGKDFSGLHFATDFDLNIEYLLGFKDEDEEGDVVVEEKNSPAGMDVNAQIGVGALYFFSDLSSVSAFANVNLGYNGAYNVFNIGVEAQVEVQTTDSFLMGVSFLYPFYCSSPTVGIPMKIMAFVGFSL